MLSNVTGTQQTCYDDDDNDVTYQGMYLTGKRDGNSPKTFAIYMKDACPTYRYIQIPFYNIGLEKLGFSLVSKNWKTHGNNPYLGKQYLLESHRKSVTVNIMVSQSWQ